MRILLLISFIFIFSSPAFSAQDVYICPMHPHISGVEGDTCPICGMALVPKAVQIPNIEHSGEAPENAVHITPTYVQALGVRSEKVKTHEFGKSIRSFGKIEASTRLEHIISVREKGWITNLKTSAVGDEVKKGDVLFTYYSPDVMSAQSDYLIALRRGNASRNTEQRLRLVGMDEKAIASFKKNRQMMENTPFHAPIDGVISALNIRLGSHLKEGGAVLSIQDFSKVWVNANVNLRDLLFLKIGSTTKIILPETGVIYNSVINYIHPITDPETRTATIRIVLDNDNGEIKPNSYVDVIFSGDVKQRLAVPTQAVIHDSRGAHVIENLGDGYFKAIMVKIGITANGFTEITNGLKSGQNVVTSGQFMIDAESNLRGATEKMEGSLAHVH